MYTRAEFLIQMHEHNWPERLRVTPEVFYALSTEFEAVVEYDDEAEHPWFMIGPTKVLVINAIEKKDKRPREVVIYGAIGNERTESESSETEDLGSA